MTALNEFKHNRLREFWLTDDPIRLLAQEWGVSNSCILHMAKRLGLPTRHNRIQQLRQGTLLRRFMGKVEARQYFENEAARRGITVTALKNKLLSIIALDKMVSAVLDDADKYIVKQDVHV